MQAHKLAEFAQGLFITTDAIDGCANWSIPGQELLSCSSLTALISATWLVPCKQPMQLATQYLVALLYLQMLQQHASADLRHA